MLRSLGDFLDAPSSQSYANDPPVGDLLATLADRLASRPARERYETLKEWTMPTPKRRMVRILTAMPQHDSVPPIFLKRGPAAPGVTPNPARVDRRDETLSTATALIEAAREVGALDALAAEARAAAGEKVENAQHLYLLVEMARGRGEAVRPQLEARLQETTRNAEAEPNSSGSARGARLAGQARAFPWTDYLLAQAAVEADDAASRDLGMRLLEALLKHARRPQDQPTLARLHGDLATARARREDSPAVAERLDGGLALWHPASTDLPYYQPGGSARSRWVAHQGHVAHIAGPGNDGLLFDYPLTGTFELSLDAYHGPGAEANLSYAGLNIEPFSQANQSAISPIGGNESTTRPWRLGRRDDFNRITVQVAPGKVRVLVNGHLFHEDDDPSPVSPWLALFAHRENQAVWRNLTIRGEPTIPRAVRLTQGDRLEGWVSRFYNESQPARLTTQGVDQYGNTTQLPKRSARAVASASASENRVIDPDAFDWCSIDGVIRGRRSLAGSRPAMRSLGEDAVPGQSRLYYHRPLRDGDSVSYEFLYEPDQVMVHPALDRMAFLLEPRGVRLHWMTRAGQDSSGLPADNAADEPENRRGPSELPLKPGEWNTMKLELSGDRIVLALNGVAIYERPMEPANSRQFGLFHDKERTSVQVRNVELRGRWPEALPAAARADLVALDPSAPTAESDHRARQVIIGDEIFGLQAEEVLARARGLDPQERYRLLANWVLPNAEHAGFRLRGSFTSTDPAPPMAPEPAQKPARTPTRVETGGELQAPATELVATASAVGRSFLNELADRILKAPASNDADRRGRLAMLALLAMEHGDDDKATEAIEQSRAMLDKVPADAPVGERWPELVVAARAIERPRLRKPALAMLGTMVEQAQKKFANTPWESQVKNLRSRALVRDELGKDAPPFGTDPELRDWARVTHGKAETRGRGVPIPQWTHRDGQFTHHPGHDDDMMYLRAPLRGDFQIDCELSTFNWRECRVNYGGMTIGLKYDLKHIQRWHFHRWLSEISINPPLEPPGDWCKYRLVVKDGSMTSFINGRQVHQVPLPPERDPWLALQCFAPLTGTARNIAITGRPAIPDQLNLSSLPDLTGWLPEYYGDSATGDNSDWEKQGEEIVGRLRDDFPGSKQESVLFYHRPMLEDGEIVYEFFYEPGKAAAHPTLDRLAFLLDPDGVKIHRLTDAQHERSGLAPDNVAVEPENRRGPASLPLKARDWNRLMLRLSGDRVSLRLNGQLIYERTLEATNQRSFGLFHYADEAEVRVRKVTYRGEWPRALPDQLRSRAEQHGATGGGK
jgi:hypothetical protein